MAAQRDSLSPFYQLGAPATRARVRVSSRALLDSIWFGCVTGSELIPLFVDSVKGLNKHLTVELAIECSPRMPALTLIRSDYSSNLQQIRHAFPRFEGEKWETEIVYSNQQPLLSSHPGIVLLKVLLRFVEYRDKIIGVDSFGLIKLTLYTVMVAT